MEDILQIKPEIEDILDKMEKDILDKPE